MNESSDSDVRLFLDWDVSKFAARREDYRAYCVAVRSEYSHLSDEIWRQKRLAFLKGLGDSFSDESKAIGNIAWEKHILEQNLCVTLSSPLQKGHYGSLSVLLPSSIQAAKPQKTIKESRTTIKDDLGNFNVRLEGIWESSEKAGNPTQNQNRAQRQTQADERFMQHDDPDVIIPDAIARPLLYTSQLLLVSCVLALIKDRYDIACVIFAVYATSLLHWSKPRFSSVYRYLDYIAVGAAVSYGTYVSTTLETKYTLIWCIGIAVVGLIFICNESFYYLQVMKFPSGRMIHKPVDLESHSNNAHADSIYCYCVDAPPTLPCTPERQWLYIRTVRVHALCVHVLANVLASLVLLSMK